MPFLYCYKYKDIFYPNTEKYGPFREFSGQTSFEITVLPDLLDKIGTFSRMRGPHRESTGPTSFENIDLSDLLDTMRTFSQIGGPEREFNGPTSFENIILHDLIDGMRTFIHISKSLCQWLCGHFCLKLLIIIFMDL